MQPGPGNRLGGLASGLLIVASVALLLTGFWPQVVRSQSLSFNAETGSPAQSGSIPLLTSPRTLHLVWPVLVRLGDSGTIRLTFNPIARADLPGGDGSLNRASASPIRLSRGDFAQSPVLVEARLEMSGMEIEPLGTTSTPLIIDQGLSFSWTVRPSLPGDYRGIVWLSLRSLPPSSGAEMERALAAIPVDIQVFSVLGFGTGPLRILGGSGVLTGLILFAFFQKQADGP
jgi:hypothetical protein